MKDSSLRTVLLLATSPLWITVLFVMALIGLANGNKRSV